MAEPLTPGAQTVDFSVLVNKAAEDCHLALKELTTLAPDQGDSERKLSLLKYIYKTRQRLLRLLVLSKWCRQMPVVERCQQLSGTVSNHDTSFTQAADYLFYRHEELQQARAPIYDIPSAAEVLLSGTYSRLPKCIEDLGVPSVLTGVERETTLDKLDTMLRSLLLDISLPKELSGVTVADGRILLRVNGEFEVSLTVGYRGNLSLWRILHLHLLVGESTGPFSLAEHQRHALGDDLERRMAASDDPFRILYTILHDFCTNLVMDTLFRQTGMLRQGRWKDAIRFEKISESATLGKSGTIGQGTGQGPGPPVDQDSEARSSMKSRGSPGLKIWYWLDVPKGIAGVDPSVPPHLRIEAGPDQSLVCSHQPTVLDPMTDDDAEFIIDQGSIDVERLLLRAIACNIHSRLMDVRDGLKGCGQLWRVDCDVELKPLTSGDDDTKDSRKSEADVNSRSSEAGEEVLCVRAYGASYVALGISIRDGRFLIRSPKTLLANSLLYEMQDALNQGSMAPVDVFLNLRSRSLLHVFASIAASFNFKVFEQGASALKFPPEAPKLGGNVLVMGFPNCEDRYFLALYLDANFMPCFRLLEGQTRSPPGRSLILSGAITVVRSMMINTDNMPVSEDDATFSFLEEGHLEAERRSTAGIHSQHLSGLEKLHMGKRKGEDMIDTLRSISGGPGMDGSQVDFSSVTDQHYRGSSGAPLSRSGNPMSPAYSQIPSPSGLQMTQGSQAFGGSSVTSQGPNGSFSPRNLGPSNSAPYRPNHSAPRVRSWVGNGDVALPGRSMPSHLKSHPFALRSKSPLHAGESAASPIDLDDDDITKIIDSIALKPAGILPGASQLSPAADSGSNTSWQQRSGANWSSQSVKSPSMNPRTPQAKSPSIQTLASGRGSGLSPSLLARIGSPQKLHGSQTGSDMPSEMMDLDPSLQTAQSSMLAPSPTAPGSLAVGAPLNSRSTLSTGASPSDSHNRKRNGSDLLFSLPSIQDLTPTSVLSKRLKIDHDSSQSLVGKTESEIFTDEMQPGLGPFVAQPFSTIVAAANQGKAPEGTYAVVLLEVVRRCWLCIKSASLAKQLEAMNIPFVEELGIGRPNYGLRFRLPEKKFDTSAPDTAGWAKIRLSLGKPQTDSWKVMVEDPHFSGLRELSKHRSTSVWGPGVQMPTLPEGDSYILCTPKGFSMTYDTIQSDSIKNMVADLERLWNARRFAVGINKLLEERSDESSEESHEGGLEQDRGFRSPTRSSDISEGGEKKWEVLRRAFRVEAVGITSIWFTCVGMIPGIHARFVIEWQAGHKGCKMHVSPEQFWPHTKYMEDYINGGDVELLLDCIRVTVGPLSFLASAIRPTRMLGPAASTAVTMPVNRGPPSTIGPKSPAVGTPMLGPVMSPNAVSSPSPTGSVQGRLLNGSTAAGSMGSISQLGSITSGPGRPASGIVPSSSLLPTDVSVILRTPYWTRIIYRKKFAMDMRCFAGDYVWLQPAPPRSGGSEAGGSLPCPQFRAFVMEHVSVCLSNAETIAGGGSVLGAGGNGNSQPGFNPIWGSGGSSTPAAVRGNPAGVSNRSLSSNALAIPNRVGNLLSGQQGVASSPVTPGRTFSATNVSMRGDYAALFGLGDDGGYGGAWVPLAALKKVLRGTLKYLGVLWLFAEFPGILKDVLGTILRDQSEGHLLNHDPEQPALRFFIGTCVFMVTMHRQQLTLQAINYKKVHQSSHAQGQGGGPEMELSTVELQELGDFFSRRVACEPYDASRLASFLTMLTLPVPVLREFLKLIVWKKEQQKLPASSLSQASDALAALRAKVELCLENRGIFGSFQTPAHEEAVGQGGSTGGGPSVAKSSIHHYRDQSAVEFSLTLSLDSSNLNVIVAGGAGWLPQCVAVRLRYDFTDIKMPRVAVLDIEGSHGGRACWQRPEDWERTRAAISRAVDNAGNAGEQGQGRLRSVADQVLISLQQNVLLLRSRP